MADLIERLRDHATDWNGEQMPNAEPAKGDPTAGTLREAADALESLQRENERLREALGVIAYEQPEDAWCVAHDALKATAVPLAAGEGGK